MKANLPKSWYSLPPIEKRAIENLVKEEAFKIADRESEETQEIWIKLSCILLHDMGLTEEELLRYIAGWKRMYRRNERCGNKEQQTVWLEKEMARCFPGGFPQMRIDEMKKTERGIFDG